MGVNLDDFSKSKKLPVFADWMAQGSCHGIEDTDLFFRHDKMSRQQAKAMCSSCPMSENCLDHAIKNKEEYGVWGGLDEVERRSLVRRLKNDKRRVHKYESNQDLTAAI